MVGERTRTREGVKMGVRARGGGDWVVDFRFVRDEEARERGGVPRGCL